ncbi:MAG: LEA type 2 family protein [Desulfobaccales bacterium]
MHSRLRRTYLATFLGLMLLATIPACGVRQLTTGEIQPPKVSWQGLTVGQPTSRGWPLAVTLLLTNPNAQPLNLKGYDYELQLEGQPVAQGASEEAVDLPAGGQTVARVPILVKLPAVMGLLPQFLPMLQKQQQQRPFHYQIAGSFRLASVMGGIIPIPFKFQGEATPQKGMDFLRPYLR